MNLVKKREYTGIPLRCRLAIPAAFASASSATVAAAEQQQQP